MNEENITNANTEEVINEEFEADWDNVDYDCNQNEEEKNMNGNMNQNNNGNNGIDITYMSDAELKELQKKINAEQAARVPTWKKWVCRIGIGVGILGAGAGIAYGAKKLFFEKEEPLADADDTACGRDWGCDVV